MKYHGIKRTVRPGDVVQIINPSDNNYLWIGRIVSLSPILNDSTIAVRLGNGISVSLHVSEVQFVDQPVNLED